MRPILVTGSSGQVGGALVRKGPAYLLPMKAPGRDQLDITDADAVSRAVAGVAGGFVFNTAAYTAVDRAESEPDRAFAANRDAPRTLARACREHGVQLFHVSTDYVFDGSGDRPWREDDPIAPLGVYGQSKAEGEAAVLEELPSAIILRTSWVFSAHGANFVKTMVRLAGERDRLRVVMDQRGCPTWADDIAQTLLRLGNRAPLEGGIYHYCGEPAVSWHGFAEAIVAGARARRPMRAEQIDAITTAEYPTAARRPANSVLDCSRLAALGIQPRPWQIGLTAVLEELLP